MHYPHVFAGFLWSTAVLLLSLAFCFSLFTAVLLKDLLAFMSDFKKERDSREQLFIWGIYSLGEDGFLAKTKLFTAGSSKGICSSVSIFTDVACCIYNFHIVFDAQYLPVCARWPST